MADLHPGVEAVLAKYLDRAVGDPDRGFIDREDLKDALRELYQLGVDGAGVLILESSSFGTFVRDVKTKLDWDRLNIEATNGSLPAGVLAIVAPDVLSEAQDFMAWDGSEWVSLRTATGGISDHGLMTGLDGDDHPQYALTDGSRGDFATLEQGDLAETAVQPEELAAVAFSGAYADLTGAPSVDFETAGTAAEGDEAHLADPNPHVQYPPMVMIDPAEIPDWDANTAYPWNSIVKAPTAYGPPAYYLAYWDDVAAGLKAPYSNNGLWLPINPDFHTSYDSWNTALGLSYLQQALTNMTYPTPWIRGAPYYEGYVVIDWMNVRTGEFEEVDSRTLRSGVLREDRALTIKAWITLQYVPSATTHPSQDPTNFQELTGVMPTESGQVLTWDGTFLRWSAPSGGAATLDELEDVNIAGAVDGDVLVYSAGNTVLPATAIADSGRWTGSLSSITDGDPNTAWTGTGQAPAFVVLDLGGPYPVDKVRLRMASGGASVSGGTFAVEHSDDNSTWTPTGASIAATSNAWTEVTFAPISARYWRLYGNTTSFWEVAEIELIISDPAWVPRNAMPALHDLADVHIADPVRMGSPAHNAILRYDLPSRTWVDDDLPLIKIPPEAENGRPLVYAYDEVFHLVPLSGASVSLGNQLSVVEGTVADITDASMATSLVLSNDGSWPGMYNVLLTFPEPVFIDEIRVQLTPVFVDGVTTSEISVSVTKLFPTHTSNGAVEVDATSDIWYGAPVAKQVGASGMDWNIRPNNMALDPDTELDHVHHGGFMVEVNDAEVSAVRINHVVFRYVTRENERLEVATTTGTDPRSPVIELESPEGRKFKLSVDEYGTLSTEEIL